MNRKILALFVGLLMMMTTSTALAAPDRMQYESRPFLVAAPSIPLVLLLLGKDHKMFYQAYNNLVDLDGDGKIDIGFNPSIVYTGYFDPYSCYAYNNGSGDDNKYFMRTGKAIDDVANPARPTGLRMSIPAPSSITGICPRTRVNERSGEDGEWSGNWLNFATTSRMDAIRKVLYGGKRHIDTSSQTILEASFLPFDSHVWGVEVVADDIWNSYHAHSPYYNISNFTPFHKPANGRMIFFARVSNMNASSYHGSKTYSSTTSREMPLLRVVANIDSNHKTDWFKTPVRMWDWALGEYPIPHFQGILPAVGNNATGRWDTDYFMRVEACSTVTGISETEGCRMYSNGTYKPAGLLQEYGESNSMYFGLMTGTINATSRNQGGAMRHHIDSIKKAIDVDNGQIVKGGLIHTIDQLRLTGWTYNQSRYQENTAWGNPMGEMLYDAVRYFARFNTPTSGYVPSSESAIPIVGSTATVSLPRLSTWTGRPAWDMASDCAKPIIMIISDVFPEADSDNIPGSSDLSLSNGISILDKLSGLTSTFPDFKLDTYLTRITENEGLSGNMYFYSKSNNFNSNGDCTGKVLTNLKDVNGLCPSEPSKKGSYAMSAVAYYAQTHDFSGGNNNPIDIYAVAMSSSFPELSFEVSGKGKISILPTALSGSQTTLFGFMNYFITDWQADVNGLPFKVTAIANFEDAFEGSDFDRDGLATYEIALITEDALVTDKDKIDRSARIDGSGKRGIFIHSGPFETRTGTNVTPANPNNEYFTFKDRWNPSSPGAAYTPIEIFPNEVLGLAIYTTAFGSTTGASMSLGYNISGSKLDGVYIDVGHNGSNNAQTPGAAWVHVPYSGRTVANGMVGGGYAAPNLTSVLNTTWDCSRSRGPESACGRVLTYEQTRSFEFSTTASAEHLPNPMFLAAKYGKFMNADDGDGFPTSGEWDSKTSGVPDTYFEVKNMTDLSVQLGRAFSDISKSVATGTATASSINSVLGGGVSIQALFHTEYTHPSESSLDNPRKISWAGYIYSVFVDKWGNMREDSNGDGILQVATGDDEALELGDMIIEFVPQESGLPTIHRYLDPKGTNEPALPKSPANRVLSSLEEIKSLWNTTQWLAYLETNSLTRSIYNTVGGRMLFTHYPDGGGTFPKNLDAFDTSSTALSKLTNRIVHNNSTIGLPVAFPGSLSTNNYFIMPLGELPPVGATNIWVQILINQADNKIEATKSGNSLIVKVMRASGDHLKAKHVVAAINDYFYTMGQVKYPLIRASLAPGDNGDWNVAAKGQVELSRNKSHIAEAIINYVTGHDLEDQVIANDSSVTYSGWRSRKIKDPWDKNGTKIVTWRLGDIINSKPVIVGAAASNYDLLYGDRKYSAFKNKVSTRRQVAYFGSNDGILHAVNLGFFGSIRSGDAKYTVTDDRNASNVAHALGAEIWGYVPSSVLPHLQWQVDPDYGQSHSYYVDLKPQIVDIRKADGEWSTILIGGLRLGGRTIEQNLTTQTVHSYSEFFALDITDPEVPPKLMWRFSNKDLGLTTSQPTVVSNQGKWYVILASGPTSDEKDRVNIGDTTGRPAASGGEAYGGSSTQNARLFILNAETGAHVKTIKSSVKDSFFNASFTPIITKRQPAHLRPASDASGSVAWTNHVVYWGMTQTRENGLDKGGLYRLRMIDDAGGILSPENWELNLMFDTERPVTGSVNSTYDLYGNLWVVFGTGRLWAKEDTSPCNGVPTAQLVACEKNHTQRLFGLKEPTDSSGNVTYGLTVNAADLLDVTDFKVYNSRNNNLSGSTYPNYNALQRALMSSAHAGYQRDLDAWKLKTASASPNFSFEISDTQPKIDGLGGGNSITGFTTFEPSTDECRPEGNSYLYSVDTYTGLPAPYMAAYNMTLPNGINASNIEKNTDNEDRIYGVMNAGKGKSTEAWFLKTETGTRLSTTGQDTTVYFVEIPGDLSQVPRMISWREVLDMGFPMQPSDYASDLNITP